MTPYDKVISDNSIEMQLAKEYYNWIKLDKVEEYYQADNILKLANFLKKNSHKLKENI